MSLPQEQLEEIEAHAGLFFSPKQVATIMGLDIGEFQEAMQDEESDIYLAYQKGFLKAEASIRKSIKELAENGSSPAQTACLDLIKQTKIETAT